jgi:hypothetical protein
MKPSAGSKPPENVTNRTAPSHLVAVLQAMLLSVPSVQMLARQCHQNNPNGQQPQRPQTKTRHPVGVRRDAAAPLHLGAQCRDGVWLGCVCDLSTVVDDAGLPRVGGQALALPFKSGLLQAAPVEVTQRDVHQLGEPAKKRRNELAKRYQMVLVIPPGRGLTGFEANHRVGVTLRTVTQRYTHQRRRLAGLETLPQRLPVPLWQIVRPQRHGRFGRDDAYFMPMCR